MTKETKNGGHGGLILRFSFLFLQISHAVQHCSCSEGTSRDCERTPPTVNDVSKL